jgi:ribose transport system ATP-binding protein
MSTAAERPQTETRPRLRFEGISKSFFGVPVLQNISFDVLPGRVLGLLGENGAGKSTLMNILGGVLAADAGSMELDGRPYDPRTPIEADRHGVVFVHQELNLFPNLSIADNLFVTDFPKVGGRGLINRRKARQDARALIERVGLKRDPRTTVDLLSPGERQQLEIAKALRSEPRVVILDEPTTSLTTRESARLFEVMDELTDGGVSIIYVSHILDDVARVTDDIAVLRDGHLVDSGPTVDFTIAVMINRMVGRDLDRLYPEKTATPRSEPLLEVEAVTEPGTVNDVSLTVHTGEVVGLFGLMGAGRSELARIIFGLDRHRSGTVRIAGKDRPKANPASTINAGLGFVTEDRRHEGLLMDSSVTDNIGLAVLPRFLGPLWSVRDRALRDASLDAGKQLNLKAARPTRQHVKSLSGGNQQKAVIAKWLLTKPKVLILDEPTRGIDVGAKHEVYRVVDELAANGTGILLISSELQELAGTCDRILVMHQGELVREFTPGEDGYDDEAILAAAFGQGGPARDESTPKEMSR